MSRAELQKRLRGRKSRQKHGKIEKISEKHLIFQKKGGIILYDDS